MSIITRTITNNTGLDISLKVPGYDTVKPPVVIPASTTVDLFTVLTGDELEAIQPLLSQYITLGEFTVIATVDTATFSPVAPPSQAPNESVPSNALLNGDFEFWNFGTSFSESDPNNEQIADNWYLARAPYIPGVQGAAFTLTRESVIVNSGLYSAKIHVTDAQSSAIIIPSNSAPNPVLYFGQFIIASLAVNTTIAGSVQIQLNTSSGAAVSPYHSGSGDWEILTTPPVYVGDSNGLLKLEVVITPSIGDYYIDTASLISREIVSLTSTQRDAISSPNTGLQIYNITTNEAEVYNGSAWVAIGGGGSPVWGTITGTLSNQTDLQTALNTKMTSIGDLLCQEVYVAIGGNDTTGDGTVGNPFASINHALSTITDAGSSQNGSAKRYSIRVASGAYNETQVLLKPYVYIIGSNYEATYIRVNGGSGSVGLDSTALTAQPTGRFGLINCYLGHGTGLNLDLHAIGPNSGTPSAVITLQNIFVTGATTITGRAPGVDYFEMYNNYFNGTFSADSLSFGPCQGCTFAGSSTLSANVVTQANISAAFSGSTFGNSLTITNTTGFAFPITFNDSSIQGTFTVSNTGLALTMDSVSLPVISRTSISGGATLTLLNDATGEGYTPSVSGNWATPPITVQTAIDRIANRLVNGGSGPL